MPAGEWGRRPSGDAPACCRHPGLGVSPSSLLLDGAGLLRLPDLTLFLALRRLDPGTWMHLRRVSDLAGQLASGVGLPPAAQRQAATAGLLHDIGKSLVPGAVLHKPTSLSRDETEMLRLHPIDGEALASTTGDPVVLDAVRHHHERLDGTGYPDGLRGDGITAVARVVAVADMYDALTSDRPYRDALPKGRALRHLGDVAGTKLDAAMVDAVGLLHTGAFSRAA